MSNRATGNCRFALVSIALLAVMFGCGPGSESAVPTESAVSTDGGDVVATIRLDISDFAIDRPTSPVASGLVAFEFLNAGPTVHEVVLAKLRGSVDELPLQPDGINIDETAPALEIVEADEFIDLDDTGGFTARVRHGRYILLCNLPGHFAGGMYSTFEVRNG